jgi:hypothetical protein
MSKIADYIELAREHHMLIEFDLIGTSWDNPEFMSITKGNEDVVLIHCLGESTVDSDEAWLSQAKNRITDMRDLGYEHVLFISSRVYGRNPHTILDHAQEIADFDPLNKLVFYVQMYWGWNESLNRNWYEDQYDMSISEAMEAFSQLNVPVEAGINARDIGDHPWIDYQTLMSAAKEHQISWLWWDWYNPYNGMMFSISSSGRYGDWMEEPEHPFGIDVGYQAAVGHEGSCQNTSVRSQYLVDGGECSAVNIIKTRKTAVVLLDRKEPSVLYDINGRQLQKNPVIQNGPGIYVTRSNSGKLVKQVLMEK